ncbi:MAG: hypothetical protein IJF16_03220 [Clostridia bacterium]|nr:hypothetical protein [Clostridia bacterium]
MAAQITNYQCPACTGPLNFSPETGKLTCEYCGSIYELSEIEELYKEKDEAAANAKQQADSSENEWDTSQFNYDWGSDAEGMKVYNCPSCTAELICDESTAATSCPYCGNPTIVPGQFTGTLKPDFVIPFKYDKDAAIAALKKHYSGRRFLPNSFTDQNHIEKIQGVYVPFWLFDGEAEGDITYDATKTRSYKQGNYRITETLHFDVLRSGNIAFEKIPVDASTKMPDAHMDSIEPYDYKELKPFSTAYLPGFLADKFDVSVEDSIKRADERCLETIESALSGTVSEYETAMSKAKDLRLKRGKVHYALMPVWLLNTKWNGQDFLFAMNGQTGKLVGDLPVDKGKYWRMFFIIGGALSVLSSLAILLLS